MTRTPILFVPGLAGSFNLPVLLDWRAPTINGWRFPPFTPYGSAFINAFREAGYTSDRDLFVAFYDWRKAVQDNVGDYLVPWIDRAISRSGYDKVILVAHSMGGLMSRSYIQSNDYRGDVEQLITLGTPHRGSAQAYYAWGGGDLRSDPNIQVVFGVYLWYLKHVHPFATELDMVRTIRTQVPSVRDLLPIDNYLVTEGTNSFKDEDAMNQRNLWGDVLNTPASLAAFVARVTLATVSGTGVETINAISVGGPPLPPEDPPRYPDGAPIEDRMADNGDGTVVVENAQIDDARVRNLPSRVVTHGSLPDHPETLGQVMAELGLAVPALGSAPVPTPQLVLMTASPVTISVLAPTGPLLAAPDAAGVLGAFPDEQTALPRQRSRLYRGRNYGHSGKHLNIIVVPNPAAGTYNLQLNGTATGSFAIGAMIVAPQGVTVLGGAGADAVPQPVATDIATVNGRVAAETELHYQVVCQTTTTAPTVRFDATTTSRNAMRRLRDAVGASAPTVLGGAADSQNEIATVLGAAPDAMRAPVQTALTSADDAANETVVTMLGDATQREQVVPLLQTVAERMVSAGNLSLAMGLMQQLHEIVRQSE